MLITSASTCLSNSCNLGSPFSQSLYFRNHATLSLTRQLVCCLPAHLAPLERLPQFTSIPELGFPHLVKVEQLLKNQIDTYGLKLSQLFSEIYPVAALSNLPIPGAAAASLPPSPTPASATTGADSGTQVHSIFPPGQSLLL